MAYLVFIFITIGLLCGFLTLTRYEAAHGARLLAPWRDRLDAYSRRVAFILAHVDLQAFLREEGQRLLSEVSHALVHLSLRAVRAVERLLTRLMRHLRRERVADRHVPVETREFVKTLSDFKGRLKDTMPEIPSVHEMQ
ncbi:hypothetical protein COU19_00090 [Candidatus Kaiserbacteria bacterium CG10_big_fil_rev_8_21_14_0_10_56_12]|uniref:Uncharacterized protein n=1 Tax=Candidatus Kaiserbacteria bacterium CG10_big_fil_rev_8_21_14_0_10_56_12 TaxID=1974611 RepID=A0A2H0UAQ6_9BACT|nr:MAG: hypothetical protein COU19_00090 [Candidatus Kaiserbacteria bacterium CG10_big_fil_rev_8_21_14_0_10_56_12]